MKYGLFSDVHSNLEAFQSVLAAMRQEKVDHYVFIGDIVGYGADPKECIKILKGMVERSGCICVGGNHDFAACGRSPYYNYTGYAKAAIEWTMDQIDESDKKFLHSMKLVERVEGFTAVHANLETPQKWGYIFDIDDAYPSFTMLLDQVCFIGHSHKPIVFICGETVDWFSEDVISLEDGVKYIVNVGSVGQPRDGNPKASFAIYDTELKRVEIRRVDYDIEAAQEKILSAGLPPMLASRLTTGK